MPATGKARRFDRLVAAAAAAVAAVGLVAFGTAYSEGLGASLTRRPSATLATDMTPLAATPVRSRVRHEVAAATNVVVVTVPASHAAAPPPPPPVVPVAAEVPRPAATIPSIQPAKTSRARLSVDANDPWGENAR
jgi:hypothetical protein